MERSLLFFAVTAPSRSPIPFFFSLSRTHASTQDLADKIAQLNSAIDDVSAQLRAQDLAAAAGVEDSVAA
jgi:hypothetical protein